MAGIRAILRDAPAGQLARLYLGLQIAPYADEQEGYVLGQQHNDEDERSEPGATNDLEKDDASEKDSSDKETSDKDIERNAAKEPSNAQPKSDPNAVEWSGPTDLDNPQNWSTLKKSFVFGQICLLTFASTFTSPTPSHGLQLIM
jgi:DHA1 family multidrug resistance protein-like MFS transporter